MKKLLVVFAKEFPYGVSEPFLELEYPLYKKYFDKVLIVTNKAKSTAIRGKQTRIVNDPTVEIVASEFNKNFLKLLEFSYNVLKDANFYKEAHSIFKSGINICSRLKDLFSSLGKANLCVKKAHKRISELEKQDYRLTAAYGYWLLYPAYSAIKLSQKYYDGNLFTVSRGHGFDLYEYRANNRYLPCRQYILGKLSEIALISEDGKKYLEQTYTNIKMNISIKRLGAKDVGSMQCATKGDTLRIVSCARLVPLKRIDRIVDSLMTIKDYKVEWTHIGGGTLFEDIQSRARNLPDNIKCEFLGTIPNTEVYRKYMESQFHVFINVSESEGVPVSIMEAMCFGTPIIATDVGGVSEMVDQGENGFLLPKNFDIIELADYLTKIYEMKNSEYQNMRYASRKIYERKYNAEVNYNSFLKELSEK